MVVGENERIERPHSMSDQAMQTDHSEKRFGVVAVQKGSGSTFQGIEGSGPR